MRKLNPIVTLSIALAASMALAACATDSRHAGETDVHDSAADVDIDTGTHLHDVWRTADTPADR